MFIQTQIFGHSEIWIYTLSIEYSSNASAIQSSAYYFSTTWMLNFKSSGSLNQLPAHCPLIAQLEC